MGRWWPTALERRIALRYLRGQRGTRSASLQTLIAIGGFAVGVMALIIVLGVMNGLSTDLRDKILIAAPHLQVLTSNPGLKVEDWQRQLEPIRHDPDVLSVAPEVSTRTLLTNTADVVEGAFVMGLEPGVGTDSVTTLGQPPHMKSGDLQFKVTSSDFDVAVVLGSKLANEMGVVVGDSLVLRPPSMLRSTGIGGSGGRAWLAEVTGTFETGMFIYDNATIVMSRTDAQEFGGLGSAVTDIGVRVRDSWKADVVARRLDSILGPQFRTETWQARNGALFSALKLEKLAMGLVIFIIMIVAAFNIVGTLTMVVAFKTREIGILLAMGLRRDGIRRIFMTQGAIVGLVGTSSGLVLGLALSWIVDGSGLISIDPSIYFIDKLPVRIEPLDVIAVVSASLLAALVATIPPSRAAAALAPVDAIRAE